MGKCAQLNVGRHHKSQHIPLTTSNTRHGRKNMSACFPKCDRALRILLLKYRNIATDTSLPRTRLPFCPSHMTYRYAAQHKKAYYIAKVRLYVSIASSQQAADNKKKFPILKCTTDMWRVLLRQRRHRNKSFTEQQNGPNKYNPFEIDQLKTGGCL